ncbi:MAG: tRNA (adenosine(37)-N6)-threonylcarbamoyltransferase complex dimerization subunit type 1 TsaB [Deltaproteobacteria bacterium]|uniref:tRNA (Adenosine(37)-N6)-threonylcarbamoyltransferase complex dimerization subunit type 1 TsaB n=1 Tax=Candidatus Zymogenus saltonus TaxID=2844893 RepID=A0A9D8PN30_9DELT|nr:tRNA (adenosine(37)-N6)-threonylcarbamoyltransferase complex dimerization subunit type 1 TsaB [Candidatus Zymogenus saltonus]
MIVLGVDTATPKASVAVLRDDALSGKASTDGKRSHSETLLFAVNSALNEAGVSLNEIGLLAVGLGPGSFTALRVGVVTMKALSYSLSVPIVGVSTLDVLAAKTKYDGVVLPVIDARKGEVFTAPFSVDASGSVKRLGEYRSLNPRSLNPRSLKPDRLLDLIELHGGDCLILGGGVPIVEEMLKGGVKIAERGLWEVDASILCRLALMKYKEAGAPDLEEIKPLYVRKSDAEINLETGKLGKRINRKR